MLLFKKFDTSISGIVLWALFLVVLLQFSSRYFLDDSVGWTEEVARYLLVILCYFGAVTCTRRDTHIKIDLYKLIIPEKHHPNIEKLNYIIASFTYFLLSYITFKFAGRTNQSLSSIEIPKNIFIYSVSISLVIMGGIALYKFVYKDQDQS